MKCSTVVILLMLPLSLCQACGSGSGGSASSDPAGTTGKVSCTAKAIQSIAPANTTIVSAGPETLGNVNVCDVQGQIGAAPSIVNYELDLPARWTGRFTMWGNGGFGGWLQPVGGADYLNALAAGYAAAATDTGHQIDQTTDPLGSFDASWALNNPTARANFLYLAIHEVTLASQAIVGAYYQQSAFNSYFDSCSTGGRQGLVEAQVYPDDFAGIVAGDPAIGLPYVGFNWNQQANLVNASTYITSDAVNLVDAAVTQVCDALDGVTDGLIQDPTKCTFDPASLECSAGASPPACLTTAQVGAFDAIYAGVTDTGGTQDYPGYTRSNPAGGWTGWITGCASNTLACVPPTFGLAEPWGTNYDSSNNGAPGQWNAQDQYLKYFVFNDANYNSTTFTFTPANVALVSDASNINGSAVLSANLSTFAAAGHKLLMYHGWSDPALSPLISVNYLNGAEAELGADAGNSVRLFMVPGMQHCTGTGPGPNEFDALTPLIEWYEKGVAPDRIVATHYPQNDQSNPPDRTMPLCNYPEEAHYSGSGNVDSAANWSCQ